MLQRARHQRETALLQFRGREGKLEGGGAGGKGCGNHGDSVSTEQTRANNEPKMSSK